jgi:ferredoxin--NADP+ reductase
MASVEHTLPVTFVEHYTESYFRFRTKRPAGFRFIAGQFIMIGLIIDGNPVMRAYSIASPVWDEEIEFYSIIVADGELTSHLQKIKVGDHVAMSKRAVGSLTLNSLSLQGKSKAKEQGNTRRLFMLSTGTGIAPFISLIRDERTYECFDEVYLTQTCRYAKDLKYSQDRIEDAKSCPLVGEEAQQKLRLYASVTREPHQYEGRITTLIENGKFFSDLGIPGLNIETDRIMICGSMEMLKDTQTVLDAAGMTHGSGHTPAHYCWEKAFSG